MSSRAIATSTATSTRTRTPTRARSTIASGFMFPGRYTRRAIHQGTPLASHYAYLRPIYDRLRHPDRAMLARSRAMLARLHVSRRSAGSGRGTAPRAHRSLGEPRRATACVAPAHAHTRTERAWRADSETGRARRTGSRSHSERVADVPGNRDDDERRKHRVDLEGHIAPSTGPMGPDRGERNHARSSAV